MPIDNNTRNTIARRQAAYSQRVKQIRSNTNLSEQGKRRELAKLYAKEQAAVAGLRNDSADSYGKRRAELEKQLFSVGSEPNYAQAVVAYRDAQDRVDKIKNGHDAQLAMRRAIRTGDAFLAKALVNRAWDQARDQLTGTGWGQVVDSYVNEMRPDLAPAVEELATLQNADNRQARMTEQVETSVLRPRELAGLTTYDMQQMAAEDAGAADNGTSSASSDRAAAEFGRFLQDSAEGSYGA